MTFFSRVLFSRGPAMHSRQFSSQVASTGGATVALSMATYYSSVTLRPPQPGEAHEFDSKAHHIKNRHGETVKFRNPHPSFSFPGQLQILEMTVKALTGTLNWPKPSAEDKLVQVIKPEFLPTRTSSPKLRATWLGHSCYYVEYPSGLRVLFDPVFEDCCTPVSLSRFKRYTEPPCSIADLPFVDAVVISHSHYDHLSYPSAKEIQQHHPNAHFFVGLGLEKWFKDGGFNNVTELDWWQEADITLTPQSGKDEAEAEAGSANSSDLPGPISAKISCLPCQHASGRGILDQNSTLWVSWAVTSGEPAKSVWFGGDTGYRAVPKVPEGVDDYGPEYQHLPVCPQFRQIGSKFGSFDLGLIPIGAYHPRYLFSGVHANPYDAVEIFTDTKCKRAMAVHWGTWVLTAEPVLQPPQLLKEALKRKGLAETGVFDTCSVGESREF